MLSGIVLGIAIGADIMASATDVFAYVVMAISILIVFITTKWYLLMRQCLITVSTRKKGLGYVALAVLPTVYNYVIDSALKSPLSLLLSGLPLIGVALYLEKVKKSIIKG